MSYHNKVLADWTEEDFKQYEADYEAHLEASYEN